MHDNCQFAAFHRPLEQERAISVVSVHFYVLCTCMPRSSQVKILQVK